MQMFSMLKREAARPSVPRSVPSHCRPFAEKEERVEVQVYSDVTTQGVQQRFGCGPVFSGDYIIQ